MFLFDGDYKEGDIPVVDHEVELDIQKYNDGCDTQLEFAIDLALEK